MQKKVSFREKMDMYDKVSLKCFAGNLWLTKCSQLKKANPVRNIRSAAEGIESKIEEIYHSM